jgi:hypothetical protein
MSNEDKCAIALARVIDRKKVFEEAIREQPRLAAYKDYIAACCEFTEAYLKTKIA